MRNFLTMAAVTLATLVVSAPAFAGFQDAISIPEPLSLSLLAGGIVTIAAVRRMRRK